MQLEQALNNHRNKLVFQHYFNEYSMNRKMINMIKFKELVIFTIIKYSEDEEDEELLEDFFMFYADDLCNTLQHDFTFYTKIIKEWIYFRKISDNSHVIIFKKIFKAQRSKMLETFKQHSNMDIVKQYKITYDKIYDFFKAYFLDEQFQFDFYINDANNVCIFLQDKQDLDLDFKSMIKQNRQTKLAQLSLNQTFNYLCRFINEFKVIIIIRKIYQDTIQKKQSNQLSHIRLTKAKRVFKKLEDQNYPKNLNALFRSQIVESNEQDNLTNIDQNIEEVFQYYINIDELQNEFSQNNKALNMYLLYIFYEQFKLQDNQITFQLLINLVKQICVSSQKITLKEFKEILNKLSLYFFIPNKNDLFNFCLKNKQKCNQFYLFIGFNQQCDFRYKLAQISSKHFQAIRKKVFEEVHQLSQQKQQYKEFFNGKEKQQDRKQQNIDQRNTIKQAYQIKSQKRSVFRSLENKAETNQKFLDANQKKYIERQEKIIIVREGKQKKYNKEVFNQTMPTSMIQQNEIRTKEQQQDTQETLEAYKSYLFDSQQNQNNPNKFYETISKINKIRNRTYTNQQRSSYLPQLANNEQKELSINH